MLITQDGSWELQIASLLHSVLIALLALCGSDPHRGCLVTDTDDVTS